MTPRRPPVVPTATYRLQLTPTEGFARLAAMAPYLARLGVSHAYLSPVLRSAPGSRHGYDVVDHSAVDEELGGRAGFEAAVAALAAHGVGVVLDVVPNHMALPVPESLNRQLWSVLRDGPDSPCARWFDVDWEQQQPLILPVLGARIDEVLDAGELVVDRDGDEAVLRYYDHVLPLRPGTEQLPLEELLGRQHYRLAFWRLAGEELNYRRFFDVDTLVAVRVEDDVVFDETHGLVVGMVRSGLVDGLRIDHPDGLADPRGYLARLADATGGAWTVAEKILEADERLPDDWLCDGTTGYDALWRITGLFVDPGGAQVLTAGFGEDAGESREWAEVAEAARREVLGGLLGAEVERLADVAYRICQSDVRLRDHSRRGLVDAVTELLACLPVYRAYVVPGEAPGPEAVAVLEAATLTAVDRRPDRSSEVKLVRDLALGRYGSGPRRDEFCVRFQQTSGPAMAKGLEDTAFYRWFPLAALNEVGAAPDRFGVDPVEFHAWSEERRRRWPYTLNATSTHDTKRSEDVRARAAALSEIPGEWLTTMRGWRGLVEPPGESPDGPDTAMEWLGWQTLVAAWPIDGERLGAYLVKAAREAKQRTSWLEPDEVHEKSLREWAHRATADLEVQAGVTRFVERVAPAYTANVLGQRAVQLAMPGIPDVYGGCEDVFLRLVDPDNRTPRPIADLEQLLDAADGDLPDPLAELGAVKARLTARGLRLRRERPDLLDAALPHIGLLARGPAADHAASFRRGDRLAVVATRFALRLAGNGGWRGTQLPLPPGQWRDVVTGAVTTSAGQVPVADLLDRLPVALLVREDG